MFKINPASLLFVSLGQSNYCNGMPLPLSGLTDSNRWQLWRS